MNIIDKIKGVVTVEVQSFFTERFINICKIRNIHIWKIINITDGIIRFNIYAKDYKKLKSIAKKTKSKFKIREKTGLYFSIFKYRKRKILFILSIFLLFIIMLSTTFIWKINIYGYDDTNLQDIYKRLDSQGIYVGKSKFMLNKNDVIKKLRSEFNEFSWIGADIEGTNLNIEIIEKIKVKDIQDKRNGDIIANSSGVITKIIPKNGTAVYKVGSYIEKGMTIIKGVIYSDFLPEKYVHAEGIIKADVEYVFEQEYNYEEIVKDYTGNKYNIGFSIGDNEYKINYLNSKYEKLKYSFKLFGISLDWYQYKEYNENVIENDKSSLIELSNIQSKEYIDKILEDISDAVVIKENVYVEDLDYGIKVKNTYIVNHEIGEFISKE